MRTILNISAILILLSNYSFAQEELTEYEMNWPQWRGPFATGVAPAGDPPVEWNESMNVKWKVEIPGKGHATPIIWGDQIILLSAVQSDKKVETQEPDEDQEQRQWMSPTSTDYIHKFVVLSVDRNNGKILWQTKVREELPHSHTHEFGSWASNSPVTDGVNIYAYFGSHGLYCLDNEGKILWERDFGQMEKVMSFGEGSSPILHEDKLIVLRDHQGQSILYVLVDILHSINEMDSNTKYRSVLPRGFLRVSASDRLCDSIHRPAPPARRLLYSWLSNTYAIYKKFALYPFSKVKWFYG